MKLTALRHRPDVCVLALAALAFASVPANRHFATGQKAKVKGVIMSRDGDLINLRESSDVVATVVLSDLTKVQVKKGVFKFRKEDLDITALVPGLRVEASGIGNAEGRLTAEKITFNPDDFKTARSVDTRVTPIENKQAEMETKQNELEGRQKQTEQDVQNAQSEAEKANAGLAELHSRVSSLDDYDTKYSATVYFATNKYDLTDQAKKDLDQLAQQALPLRGYMIEVAGYADTTGDAKRNQELSELRAEAVVQYLQQVGRIPLRRILAPAGLGTSQSAADNSTAEGREKNRRVEVRVIVNRAESSAPKQG
ncbi:MAG: OmpA family protein [Acidobacteriaceae bacterium]|nr:OmpA family protein [Acidobacteriaceae bacterium]MBV8570681.1 OmpA family protein [Acidobacteriaceae bacterium]